MVHSEPRDSACLKRPYDTRQVDRPAGSTWRAERLEYAASLRASLGGREIAIDAVEHHGGTLGWAHFELRDIGPSAAEGERGVATAVPSTVQYRGMRAATGSWRTARV